MTSIFQIPAWPDFGLLNRYLAQPREAQTLTALCETMGEQTVLGALQNFDNLRVEANHRFLAVSIRPPIVQRLLNPVWPLECSRTTEPPSIQTSPRYVLRDFEAKDSPAILEIRRLARPYDHASLQELRSQDNRRWVIEIEGRVVGAAELRRAPLGPGSRKFEINLDVHPEAQKKGVGNTLYLKLIETLEELGARSVFVALREDMTQGFRFLGSRGFKVSQRAWESVLELDRFDSERFEGLIEGMEKTGLKIKTLGEVRGDPGYAAKLYGLFQDLVRDLPFPDEDRPQMDFKSFEERLLQNPEVPAEACFVAVHSGNYIGLTYLSEKEAGAVLETRLTGVRAGSRRNGVALALKLAGIDYARRHGYQKITCQNEANNRAILALNRRLGFVRTLGWLVLMKDMAGF